jgi:hypothetical protein
MSHNLFFRISPTNSAPVKPSTSVITVKLNVDTFINEGRYSDFQLFYITMIRCNSEIKKSFCQRIRRKERWNTRQRGTLIFWNFLWFVDCVIWNPPFQRREEVSSLHFAFCAGEREEENIKKMWIKTIVYSMKNRGYEVSILIQKMFQGVKEA